MIQGENQGAENPEAINSGAKYAQQLFELGGSLNLGPSIQQQEDGTFSVADIQRPEDVLSFYEQNPNLKLDLNAPDWESTWDKLSEGIRKRHTDYLELFGEAAGQIANVPFDLIEGVAEQKNPAKIAYSGFEGTARSIRDMWGFFAESENPESWSFQFRALISALKQGKTSISKREQAEQWNKVREFMYHSHRMQSGDESFLEQFDTLNLSEDTKSMVRSWVNPKVAHAFSFFGMELPSLLSAPFTGGASAGAAIAAAQSGVVQASKIAANQSRIMRIGETLAASEQRFQNMANKFTTKFAGYASYAAGSAIQPIANIAESVLGGSIAAIAERGGISNQAAKNAITVSIVNGAETLGATGVRQTVGFVGSFGLRTTAELLKEIGDTALNRGLGTIPVSEINGLTVLERVARSKNLSNTARMAAKTANVIVDPFLQLSTAGLKNAYKDAIIFSGIGFWNDRDRGAISGAAAGLVWGGYSGAFRHTWSNVSGGFQHSLTIDNFDNNFVNYAEKFNQSFAKVSREITAEADKFKSTRVSANVRATLQTAFMMMDFSDRKNALFHVGDVESLVKEMKSRNLDITHVAKSGGPKGMFTLARSLKPGEKAVPVIFLNKSSYRPVEVPHEMLGHLGSYSLHQKGKLGSMMKQLIGTEQNGGAIGNDDVLLEPYIRRKVAEELIAINAGSSISDISARAKAVNEASSEIVKMARKTAHDRLARIRSYAKEHGEKYWSGEVEVADQNGNKSRMPYAEQLDLEAGQMMRDLYEETVSTGSEILFTHSNIGEAMFEGSKPLRMYLEQFRSELFAKKLTQNELAGIFARQGEVFIENGKNAGSPSVNAIVYDNGKYYRHPELEGLIKQHIRLATELDAQGVAKLSPERQAIEARRFGKEFLFKFNKSGAQMLGTKEQNELFTKNASKALSVLESLPAEVRPEISVDEHGNKSVDMYKMRDEAYDALIAAGAIDQHSAHVAKGFRDVMAKWESSGFSTSNIFSATYYGDSHRTNKRGFLMRIFGNETPVTDRVFVPYELRMSLRTTDSEGRPLRAPRGGMVATVVDYMAIHRRKMKNWSKADFQAMFGTIENYNRLFDLYMMNMMKEPASRVPSAELFRAEFKDKAEQVRDMLWETFGGRRRQDESYINTPRDGSLSNPEDPNYPIHSMKLELLVNPEVMPMSPFPYHHGRSYEGLRRNFSVAGFEIYDKDGKHLRDGQGYEIIAAGSKFKAFNPFGTLIGVFDSANKAVKATRKDMRKMDPSDIMPMPVAIEDAKLPTTKEPEEPKYNRSASYLQSLNNGIRQSTGVLGDDGVVYHFKEDFLDNVFDVLHMSHDRMWKDDKGYFIRYKAGKGGIIDTRRWQNGRFLTLSDIQKDKGSAMDRILSKAGLTWGSADIAVVPSADRSSVGVKDAYVQRLHVEKDGVYAYWEGNSQTGMPTIFIDTEGLSRDIPNPKARENAVRALIENEVESITRQYGRESEITGGHSVHPSYVSSGTRQGQLAQVEYIQDALSKTKKEFNNDELVAIQDAKNNFTEAIGLLSDAIDDNGELAAGGPLDPSKIKTIKDFRAAIKKITKGYESVIPASMGELPARDLLELTSILVRAMTEASKTSDYWFAPTPNGELRALPMMRGPKIAKAFSDLENFTRTKLNGPNKELNDVYVRFANKVSHAYIQINKHAAIEEMAAKGSQSVILPNLPESSTYRYLISPLVVAKNLGFESSDVWKNKALTPQSDLKLFLNNGAVYTIGPGSNLIGGFIGSESDVGMGSNRFKNLAMPIIDGHLPLNTLDGVSFHKSMGWLMPEADRKRGRHIDSLLIVAMSEMPDRQNEIVDAYNSSKQTKDYSSFADFVMNAASEDGMHSSIIGSMVVKTMIDVDSGRLKFNSPDYAKDWTASQFTNWLSRYWALPVNDEAIGVKKSEPVALRMIKAKGGETSDTIKSFNRSLAMLAKAHKWADREMNPDWERTKFSVGNLDMLAEKTRDEMKAKGLVSEATFNGKTIRMFEFSDAGASLNLAKAANRPHILPFLSTPDPEGAFSDYAAAVRRRLTLPPEQRYISDNIILGDAKLGDIFEHAELYRYYPEFRDIKVHFKDFHGGRHINAGGTSIIELGLRSFAAAELNLPAEQMGSIFNNKEALRSQWMKENPLSSIILHEVQHAIQLKHGWIGNDIQLKDIPRKVAAHAFGNLLGIKTSLALKSDLINSLKEPDIMMKGGRFVELREADRAANSEAELLMRMVEASKSPVIRSLKTNAKPLMVSAARNFADFILSEHELGNVSDAMAKKAMELHFDAKFAGTLDAVIDVYQRLVDFRRESILTNPNYSIRMHDNMQFRTAFNALGLVSTFDVLDAAMPTEAATLLMQAISDYKDMSYVMAPVEKMARETEQRRGKTEAELAAEPRVATDDNVKDPVLKIIRNAMDMSKLGSDRDMVKNISQHGIAPVILQSVGGLGETDVTDSRVLTLMGKAVLMHGIAEMSNQTLDILKRVTVRTNGWQVDKNGKMTITTGTHILKGVTSEEFSKNIKGVFGEENIQFASDGSGMHIPGTVLATEGHTYTIEDLAVLSGAVVESSSVFTVGNSAIDAVMAPHFPAYFKGSDVMDLMRKSGIATEDAMAVAKVEKIANAFSDVTLTKNDLINLMAVNHSQFIMPTQMASANSFPIARASDVFAKAAATADSAKRRKVVIGEVGKQYFQKVLGVNGFGASVHNFALGYFTVSGSKIIFETGEAPKWVKDLGDEAVVKWEKISNNVAKKLAERDRTTFIGDSELRDQTVDRLNNQFMAKATLVDSLVNEAINAITADNSISNENKLMVALGLMDDIERANMVLVSHEIAAKHPDKVSLTLGDASYNFVTPGGTVTHALANLPKRTGGKEGAPLAIGGYGTEHPTTGFDYGRREMNPALLQLSLFNPSAVSLADAASHATSTIHVGVVPVTSIQPLSRPLVASDKGYEQSVTKTTLSTLSQRSVDYSIRDQIVEQVSLKRDRRLREISEEKDSLRAIMKGDREGVLDVHADLTAEQAETLFESLINETLSLGRDHLVLDKIANSELFSESYNTDNQYHGHRGVHIDVAGRREGAAVQGQQSIAISNAQGRVIGDSLVVDVEQVIPSLKADSYFASSGMTMRLVPLDVRRRYVRGKTYQDLALAVSLFGSIMDTGIPEQKVLRPTSRLAKLGEISLEIAGDDKFSGPSSYTVVRDTGLAHVVGGNAVLVVGNLMEAGLSSGNMKNYVSANTARVQEIFGGNDNIYSKPSTSLSGKISANENGGTIRVNNRSLGMAAAFPLAVMLKHGFMDFWEKDAELSLNVPSAFRGVEYKFLTSPDGFTEFDTGFLVPETDALLDAFIAKLDTHAIDAMVEELSTNQNARTVSDLMAYMNLHELINKDKTEPVPKLGDKPLQASVDFALTTSAHYNTKIHAALADDIAGFSPAMMKDYIRVISEAIRTKDFWIGFFSQPRAAKAMDSYVPRANNSGTGMFYTRHSQADSRVPVFYGTTGGSNIYRTNVKNGHSVDNISYTDFNVEGLMTFSENKIGIDDPLWEKAYGERGYNSGPNRTVISATHRPNGLSIPEEIAFKHYEEFNAAEITSLGRYDKTESLGSIISDETGAPVTKIVQETGGKIKALPGPSYLSDGARRTLMVNQIADMAKKLGVQKVSIQPARYTATSRPDPLLYGFRTSTSVAEAAGRSGFGLTQALTSGFNFGVRRSVENKPSLGFSWNRLEDGRILVNFSPDTNIIANGDRAYASVSDKHHIGINLSRVLGYNHDFGGIITPQDPRYQATAAGLGHAYSRSNNVRESGRVLGYASKNVFGHLPFFGADGAIDQALIRHYRKAVSAELRRNVAGPVYAERLLLDQSTSGLRGKGLVAREMETAYRNANTDVPPVLGPSASAGGIIEFINGNGGVISGLKNDYGYVSFVLPRDATIDQFQRAVMSYYLMASERNNVDVFSEAGMFNAKSKFLTQNFSWSRSGTYFDNMMASLGSKDEASSAGKDMSVRDYSAISSPKADGSSNVVGTRYALLLGRLNERDPLFLSGLEQTFQMMTSSDKGYHMPLAEQNLRQSGDRLAIIRAMFPGRPELEQFAWDNADAMNLSVVAPSKGSGNRSWLVGYDKVVGYNSTGMPIKERVVRSHRTESDARQFANSVAKSGILAEHVKMLSLETDASIQKLPSDPNVSADIYQPLRLNEAAIDTEAPIFTKDSTYAVGNFAKTFQTEAEARAFQNMVLESEAITGKAPQPGTVRLSTGDLASMERDLRHKIGFSVFGSPLQFASTAMNAIVRGADKNKQFRDKATGLQWYDMLTFNGVGKQEMRVVGLAQFLYDHRSVTLSRQEVAEYIYAMYPITGRRSLVERAGAGSAEGRIPDTRSPIGTARAMAHQYKLMHHDMFAKLKELEEAAADGDKPQLAAFTEALKAKHLDAFKKALSEFYPAEKVDEMLPSYSHLQGAFSLDREMLKISGPLMEIYREGYNDMIRSMPQEQLNLAAGVELLLPDPRGHYDQQNARPGYLRPLESSPSSEQLEINGNRVFTNETGGRDWAEYTSSASGPYHVDVLFGRSAVDSKDFETYKQAIRLRMQENANNPAEVQRLESMLASAQRTFEFRKHAAQKSRQNGHWNTGDGTMQYTHLRYSGVVALAESLPNPDPLELVDSVNQTSYAGERGAGQFVTLIEELQSDPYQRATFGPPKDAEQMSASDFKQAEAFGLIPELKAINKELSVFEVSADSKITPVKWNFDWPRTNNSRVINHAIIAPIFFERLSLPEKHMVLRLTIENGNDINPSYDVRPESAIMLSKEEASKYGLPQEIRPFSLSKVDEAVVHGYLTGNLLSEQYAGDGGIMHSYNFARALFPERTGVVPNLDGKFEYANYFQTYNRTPKGLAGQIYAMLGFMALGDESLHASAERLATILERGTQHGIDFDAMAYSFMNEFSRRLSENTTLSPSSKEYANLMLLSMEEMLKQNEINPEHLVKDFKGNKWHRYELTENDYESWSQKKFVYYLDSSQEAGRQYPRYLAMTPVEAVMYDLELSKQSTLKIPGQMELQKATYEEAKRRGDNPLQNTYAFLRSIYMHEPEGTVTPEMIKSSIQNGHDFGQLQRVDGDMDPTSTTVSGSMYLAFPHEAKTPLGRVLELNAFYAMSSVYQFGGDVKANELRQKRSELMARMKLPEPKDYNFPDTIPLGEDNAYRELAVKYYAMRALQAGQNGLVIADARHHRTRYSSLEYMSAMVTLGKGHVYAIGKQNLAVPYVLSKAVEKKAHGDFFGRLVSGEMSSGLRTDGQIEHNGLIAFVDGHIAAMAREVIPELPQISSDLSPEQFGQGVAGIRVNTPNGQYALKQVLTEIIGGRRGPVASEILLELSQQYHGTEQGLDIFKRVAKYVDNPQYLMSNVPVEKTHGYAVNYGAPHWNNLVYYAGLPADFIAKQSHDLFARPVVEMKDGKFNILDPKTGKLLIGGIESQGELMERMAQLSKYLGSVPIVSVFLKQFARVGGYAMEGHLFEGSSANTFSGKMTESAVARFKEKYPGIPLDEARLKMNRATSGTDASALSPFGMNAVVGGETEPATVGKIRSFNQIRKAAEGWNSAPNYQNATNAVMLHAMGITSSSDSLQVAHAVNRMVGFNGPMLIIKPRYQTEAFRKEMLKMVRSGIPLMSVGDLQNPAARVNEAIKAYKFYEDIKPLSARRTQDEER